MWDELARDMERMRREDDLRKEAFGVKVDVQGFQPEDLCINIEGNVLTIEGCHEDKSGESFSCHHFKKSFTIPDNVEKQQFKSLLAKDGRTLRIEAPMVQAVEEKKEEEQKEVPIQINHVKSVTD